MFVVNQEATPVMFFVVAQETTFYPSEQLSTFSYIQIMSFSGQ